MKRLKLNTFWITAALVGCVAGFAPQWGGAVGFAGFAALLVADQLAKKTFFAVTYRRSGLRQDWITGSLRFGEAVETRTFGCRTITTVEQMRDWWAARQGEDYPLEKCRILPLGEYIMIKLRLKQA